MPGGDGTGPNGTGGRCTPLWQSGQISRPVGFFGRGRGNRFWARVTGLPGWQRSGQTTSQEPAWNQEIPALQDDKAYLKQEMKAIEDRLSEIEKRLNEVKK